MIRRGDIVYLKNAGYLAAIGHVQGGQRPMLIVSNDKGNKTSHIVIAVPLTTNKRRLDLPTHVIVNDGKSVALCEQIFTFNQDFIDRKINHINSETMKQVDKCLAASLGLMI